jgi:hypothetical protein
MSFTPEHVSGEDESRAYIVGTTVPGPSARVCKKGRPIVWARASSWPSDTYQLY